MNRCKRCGKRKKRGAKHRCCQEDIRRYVAGDYVLGDYSFDEDGTFIPGSGAPMLPSEDDDADVRMSEHQMQRRRFGASYG